MKKVLFLALTFMFMFSATSYADIGTKTDPKEVRKERKEIQKMKTKDLNKELKKMVDREFNKIQSAGWRCKEGDDALKGYIENAFTVQFEYDDELLPRSFVSEGTAMGRDYDLARDKAIYQAQNNLADAAQKELKLMLEFAESEKKIKPKDSKVVRASVVSIMKELSESISDAQVIYELTGAQGNNNEIFVKIGCPGVHLMKKAQELLRVDLRQKGEKVLADRVSIIFNWREATKAEKVK